MERELADLLQKYERCWVAPPDETKSDIMGANELEMPASLIGIAPEVSSNPEEAEDEILEFLRRHFYIETAEVTDWAKVDTIDVYLSRFRNLLQVLVDYGGPSRRGRSVVRLRNGSGCGFCEETGDVK